MAGGMVMGLVSDSWFEWFAVGRVEGQLALCERHCNTKVALSRGLWDPGTNRFEDGDGWNGSRNAR
ncbi:MAG TPA: hypothetical protein DCY79_09990 [Planctomycetaceae bacterium]|nr:hypothetical protein [Planctomycetaceae bacterium]